MATASSDEDDYIPIESADVATLTLTGTITNDNPDLSWNSVNNADEYLIKRLPVPATGYSDDEFVTASTYFLDQGVDVIEQTGGFCQIRYVVEAYNGITLLATSNPVDYITAPDPDLGEPGNCNP